MVHKLHSKTKQVRSVPCGEVSSEDNKTCTSRPGNCTQGACRGRHSPSAQTRPTLDTPLPPDFILFLFLFYLLSCLVVLFKCVYCYIPICCNGRQPVCVTFVRAVTKLNHQSLMYKVSANHIRVSSLFFKGESHHSFV